MQKTILTAERSHAIGVALARDKWRLEDSIFAKKGKENDSKSFWNRKGISEDAFDFDWSICCQKGRFIRLIENNATKVLMKHEGLHNFHIIIFIS